MVKQLIKVKRTKSFYFLLPMIGGNNLTILDFPNVVNCYLKDKNKHYEDSIFVLFKWSSDPNFTAFEGLLQNHEFFSESYDVAKYYVMFVFGIPDWKNYNLFIDGKYSKFDDSYKQQILKFLTPIVNNKQEGVDSTVIREILYKDDKRRKKMEEELDVKIPLDVDLAEAPTSLDEIFDVDKFK